MEIHCNSKNFSVLILIFNIPNSIFVSHLNALQYRPVVNGFKCCTLHVYAFSRLLHSHFGYFFWICSFFIFSFNSLFFHRSVFFLIDLSLPPNVQAFKTFRANYVVKNVQHFVVGVLFCDSILTCGEYEKNTQPIARFQVF